MFGNRNVRRLAEALDTLRLQVAVQASGPAAEKHKQTVLELIATLRDSGKIDQAAAEIDKARSMSLPTAFGLGSGPEAAKRSLERVGLRVNPDATTKWNELLTLFDRALVGARKPYVDRVAELSHGHGAG